MVIDQFPFGNTEEDDVDYSLLDSLQIAQIEEEFQVKQDQEAEEHWKMIKNDFPTLSEQEIAENLNVIDEYYSQNLDYVTLEAIAEHEEEIMAKTNYNKIAIDEDDLACLIHNIGLITAFNPIQANYAGSKAKEAADKAITEHYLSSNGVPIPDADSVKNTYKHMVFSAFLAQKYFTIISKSTRLLFAETVGNRHEYCNPNDGDSREMDFHNNAIGRTIWEKNTPHRRFGGVVVGLNRPSDAKLKQEIRNSIELYACFIVKKNIKDRFPENEQDNDLSRGEVTNKIRNTQNHIPVYFIGPIKEPRYTFVNQSAGFEIVECDDRNSQGNGGTPTKGNPSGPAMCEREIFISVAKEVEPCFKL